MPINTLKFVAQVALEMIELRQSEELSDIEVAIEVEERYIALIERLSENEYLLGSISSLIDQAENKELLLSNEMMSEVFFHLVCRTLQSDWIDALFNLIESGDYSIDVLNLVFYLPLEHLEYVFALAMKHGETIKLWVVGWCIRNNRLDLINVMDVTADDNECQYVAQFIIQKHCKDNPHYLDEKLLCNDYDRKMKIIFSLGLYSSDRNKSLSYMKSDECLTSLSTNSSDWLAFSGGNSELRYIESIVERFLSEYNSNGTDDDLRKVMILTDALVNWGDLKVIQWLYKVFIPHSHPRIRGLGLIAMSQFFSERAQNEIQHWLSDFKKDKDSLGTFPLFSTIEAKLFLHQLEVRSSQPLIAEIDRYKATMRMKKTAKVRAMLDDIGYADVLLANKVRLYVYLLTEQFYPLDELGRYSQFIRQKEQIKACI
ncbi:TPA: hypothetical protein ACVU1O_003446 [Vibrio cholerae]